MKSKIKRAAELRTTLSQRRWGPAKRVTGAMVCIIFQKYLAPYSLLRSLSMRGKGYESMIVFLFNSQ